MYFIFKKILLFYCSFCVSFNIAYLNQIEAEVDKC